MFSFTKLNKLYETGVLKDHLEAKNYIEKFFCPLTNGEHAHMENGKATIVPKETMKEVYLNRFPDEIIKWYTKKTIPKQLICDVTKSQIGDRFVNIAPQMFKDRKEYSTFTQKSRDGVKRMIAFLKEVWCDNDKAQLQYVLKWFACVLKGKKNQSILYVKSIEGVGKSTFTDFFIQYVLGSELHAKGDKECLCSPYNLDLMGKPFVIFEELPVMNKNEWNVCDGKLKDMATGTEMNFCEKYQKKFRAANINNYCIITNHKAIKRPDGRRYYVVDIDTKYCNDHQYFGELRDQCFNEKVGYAFYNYLLELDADDFKSLEMPETTAKLNMIADLLTPIEKFLKFNFLLENAPVKHKVKDLYAKYEKYCDDNTLHVDSKIEFTAGMKQYGFNFKMINGYNCYRITVDQLKEIAGRRKWLHELDEIETDEVAAEDDDDDADDNGVDLSDKSVDVSAAYTKLLSKYNALLRQVNGIKNKGFGVLFEDDDEQQYIHSSFDDDSNDDEEEKIVAKVPNKKTKDLSKKEVDECLATIDFL
ncbi:MAG: hypothetical protein EOP48_05260 [Sphingobacteriales bacterium]|nr:MAG: hypothetical protein EOP48_05260 [Sphingobacteriales bacterium]